MSCQRCGYFIAPKNQPIGYAGQICNCPFPKEQYISQPTPFNTQSLSDLEFKTEILQQIDILQESIHILSDKMRQLERKFKNE